MLVILQELRHLIKQAISRPTLSDRENKQTQVHREEGARNVLGNKCCNCDGTGLSEVGFLIEDNPPSSFGKGVDFYHFNCPMWNELPPLLGIHSGKKYVSRLPND